ncbi:hypothetical protein AB3S75_002624 [Citrus x aurantiifolia]
MERFRKIPKLFICLIILLYLQTIISAVNGDHGGQNIAQNKEEESSLAQFVVETISRLRASHKSSWEKVKSIIHEMQLRFSPPNLDFKGPNKANVGAKQEAEKVKEAAKKTAGVSKMAVEESAKSAAEAVHKTAEKVKDSVSPDKGAAQDEL